MTTSILGVYITLLIVGVAFGWSSSNFVYGRKVCRECLVALIRGRACDDCEYRGNKKGDMNGN